MSENHENSSEPTPTALPEIKYYAAVLQADGTYSTETFDTVEALANRLKELAGKDASVFTFAGAQLAISKPPFRHLLTPWGNLPLFDLPEQLEPDETGYLGADAIHLGDPPQLRMPAQSSARPPVQDDGFFDTDSDPVMGAFDEPLPDPGG